MSPFARGVLVLVWIYVLAVVLYVNDFDVFAGILGIWALWRTIRVAHARHVSQSQTQFLRQLIREQEWRIMDGLSLLINLAIRAL